MSALSKRLLIRADATAQMGTGHVMRCLALALAAQDYGLDVLLMGRIEVPWVVARLREEGINFECLPGSTPSHEEPMELLNRIASFKPQMVVLDGYHFGLDCHKAVMAGGYKLLVIDDYAHLPEYQADILLNQNAGSELIAYKGAVGQYLLGPSFALLRPEFLRARPMAETRNFNGLARNILLTLGGGDFAHFLPYLVPALSIPEMAGATLRVLAGSMSENAIREALSGSPAEIEILSRVNDIPNLLLWADLCVTAGGSTCWELCCLGVPFLTVELAENQRASMEYLAKMHIAPIFSLIDFKLYLSDCFCRQAISNAALPLVDGRGCSKILGTMLEINRE